MRNERLKSLTIYVTAQEEEMLKAEAEGSGVTVSYLLRALIDQYSPVKLPPMQRGAPHRAKRVKSNEL